MAGLLVLLAIYRREPGPAELPFGVRVEDWAWLRSGWWGILGLIGLAYLTVGILVLLLGWLREWLMGSLALLIMVGSSLSVPRFVAAVRPLARSPRWGLDEV